MVEPGRSYFDTNIDDHHHFYVEGSGQLLDIPGHSVSLAGLPTPPDGTEISRVDVIIRIGPARVYEQDPIAYDRILLSTYWSDANS